MFGSSPISAAPFAALAGGANFDNTITESVLATETTAATPIYVSFISETQTASDTVEVAASAFNVLYSESASINDANSAVITVLSSLSESIQLVDTATTSVVFPVSFEDSASTLDLASAAIDFSCAINETSQASDLVSAVVLLLCSVADSSTLSDDLSAAISYPATVSEAATGTVSDNALVDFSANIVDTLTGSDSFLVAPSTFNASVSEQLNAVAEFFSAVVFIANTTEGAVIADQLLASFLWEVIDTAQSAEWAPVNDSQSVTWNITLTNS